MGGTNGRAGQPGQQRAWSHQTFKTHSLLCFSQQYIGGEAQGQRVLCGEIDGAGGHTRPAGRRVAKPSGDLQGADVLVVLVWDGVGAVYPISILLGFPWKGDTNSTFVSPRHQMWGGALSTFWQFLQPQLPRAVPL